jgi:hypothetical protein
MSTISNTPLKHVLQLQQTASYKISQQGPEKPSLFNKTQIGQYTGQEDIDMADDEEQAITRVFSRLRTLRK